MGEHSLQSPFLFNIYHKALNPYTRVKIRDADIESLRKRLVSDPGKITVNQFGSGSSMWVRSSRKISQIARRGVSNRKQSEVLVNLIESLNFKFILELGTSLGLNTAYLSKARGVLEVITVEGNSQLASIAQNNFDQLGISNVKLIVENIDTYLDNNTGSFDLIYIDANHTYESTLNYFNSALKVLSSEGVILIDDINWSPGMNKAWAQIVSECKNCLTIENDKFGIIFADKSVEKNHYILQF